MESVEMMFLLLAILVILFAYKRIDPKLDWNYETGERILWYNDPFDSCQRKAIILWKKKT